MKNTNQENTYQDTFIENVDIDDESEPVDIVNRADYCETDDNIVDCLETMHPLPGKQHQAVESTKQK